MERIVPSRRQVIVLLAGAGVALGRARAATPPAPAAGSEVDVAPAEDLMREHGLLNRILLIYEEGIRRLEGTADLPQTVLPAAADVIRRFVEDYHEKLEEQHLFPRFEKAGVLVDLVHTLKSQHEAGRGVTAEILRLAGAGKDPAQRHKLAEELRQFVRMYRPHEAREDTVLFPALHGLVSKEEYEDLGDRFEDKERELFGEHGFESMVETVAGLEKQLGIYDLAQFTPKKS
jgi:hemerythrin-like domain-containing protein